MPHTNHITTPELILDSAAQLFSTNGFHLTTTRAIAAKAGVNIALLHYYFNSKNGTLVALLERLGRITSDRIRELLRPGGDPWIKVQQYVQAFFQVMLLEHREFLVIVSRQCAVAEPSAISQVAALTLSPHLDLLHQIVQEGAEAGAFARGHATEAFSIILGIAIVQGACAPSLQKIGTKQLGIEDLSRLCISALAPVLKVNAASADRVRTAPPPQEFHTMQNTDLDFVD
ncbi:MAG: hypothetical protein AMXMBFR4_34270 [Candidatus Hydrogenedentota bacterium]